MGKGNFADSQKGEPLHALAEFKESDMHDFLAGLVFIAIVMTPCIVALTVKLGGAGSK